jgi:integrase
VRVFTDDEYKALLAACQASSDPRLEPLFLLACSSAARISELLALRRPDVNLVAGDAVVWNSKNGQSRVLRFRGPAVEALRAYVAATPEPITRHVFVGPRGPTEPRSAWEGAMRAAGVEDAGWHTCRHTSLTWLAMQGASEHELMDHAGHKTSAMASRYVHLAAVHRSKVAPELVARRFQAA